MLSPRLCAHLCALGTTVVWGMTVISTKVLLEDYTPLEIALYRFILAVAVMHVLWPRRFRHGGGWRTELLFLGAGASGITLYFFCENLALTYTYASNVSLIICAAPFLTGLGARLFLGETLHANFFTGFLVAMTGIFCISFTGVTVLKLNPAGDLLALLAGRFLAFVRTLLPTMAGISGLPNRRFQFFNWLSGLLWVSVVTSFGYALSMIPFVKRHEDQVMTFLMILPIALLTAGLLGTLFVVIKKKYCNA